jgi:hypothetical protein
MCDQVEKRRHDDEQTDREAGRQRAQHGGRRRAMDRSGQG